MLAGQKGSPVPLRILIVEGDPVQRETLAAFLRTRGHYVDTSEDGLGALRMGRLGWFNLVLMDYHLPEIDGLAAARLISESVRGDVRPVIIALSAEIDLLRANAGGSGACGSEIVFDGLVQKPWDPDALIATMERCFEARGLRSVAPVVEVAGPVGDGGSGAALPNAIRMLIVDDDDLFRSVLATALRSNGFSVDSSARGIEALRMIGRSHYDAAILDYHLPEIDGLAIARLTHELVPGVQRPRLIGLTSSPEDLNGREAGSLSAFDDVILKSSDLGGILSSIERSLTYRRLRSKPASVNILELMQSALSS